MKIYSSQNFLSFFYWFKRTIFSTILIGFFVLPIYFIKGEFSILLWTSICLLWILIIVVGQAEEITITDEFFIIEKKSLMPFLRRQEKIPYMEIVSVNVISNQTTNDRGWLLFERKVKNTLELNLRDGYRRIKGSMYPKGATALKEKICGFINSESISKN